VGARQRQQRHRPETSVRPFVPIIDYDMEEEDHYHGLATVRCQSIVVDETGDRRSFLLRRGTSGSSGKPDIVCRVRSAQFSRWCGGTMRLLATYSLLCRAKGRYCSPIKFGCSCCMVCLQNASWAASPTKNHGRFSRSRATIILLPSLVRPCCPCCCR
jgi:hypothetical protein